ncbi:MAG TPA: hypothetical protein PLZ05_01480 [Alphaproteobacteria bacterium]|nr:hypothetical protein [Alphaproteobacteria bacterium]
MKKLLFTLFILLLATPAHASWGIVDSFNLAPLVPIVLDALMSVATGTYEFFVGNGDGIIYVMIWGILGVSIGLYFIKMYFPKTWVAFFGFSGGGEMWEGKTTALQMVQDKILKPAMRAIIAATILLQIKPIYVTDWIVNPFLKFGSMYTQGIADSMNVNSAPAKQIECPKQIIDKGWISADSCNFMVQPVSILSNENNKIIKRGFEFITRGLSGLMTLVPHGGEDFLNLITGIFLVWTFVASNFFMALLIINGIFNFGMSLILYPFQVLTWVAKPKNPDKWIDPWPAFEGIVKSLQQLIITMIACVFILVINIAIIRALFQWNSSVFVVAAGGSATSNVPTVANNAIGFGQHSILWLSTILTFYLMFRIFNMTREMITKYAPGSDGLYNKVKDDPKNAWKGIKEFGSKVGTAAGWFKKK